MAGVTSNTPMNAPVSNLHNLRPYGVKYSKNGYIIATNKNLTRLLDLFKVVEAHMAGFDGMTDGMGAMHEVGLVTAVAKAHEVIAAGRFGRGISLSPAENTSYRRAVLSVGDCCYDIDFVLDA